MPNMLPDQEIRQAHLTRSWSNRVIAGVCSGLARDLKTETWIIRSAAVVLLFVEPVIAVLAYLIAWAIIPSESDTGMARTRRTPAGGRVLGIILVMAGTVIAVKELAPWLDFTFLGAAALVALGAIILNRGRT